MRPSVQRRAAHRDLAQRAASIADQRNHQRECRQHRENRQGLAGERVLQAAAQDYSRTEHARDADRVDQPERRQQHEPLEEDVDRSRHARRGRAGQHRDDRHTVLDRVGDHAGHSGVDGHADAAALAGVVIEAVAIHALRDHREVDAERGGKRGGIDRRMRRVPDRAVTGGIDAGEVESGHEARSEHRSRGCERHRLQPRTADDQRRPGREVQDGERDGRERQGTGDPREHREHMPERQAAFGPEERPAAGHGAESEGGGTESRCSIVAPQEEQHQGSTEKDDELYNHAEVEAHPATHHT